MLRKSFIVLLAACLLTVTYGFNKKQSAADPAFSRIDTIVKSLSDITGLNEKHAVPYGRMTQPQLRKFLAHRIKSTVKPKELQADELTLKLFGLVPSGFDLKKTTVDLLTEQAAAFYDYEAKKLFLLNAPSSLAEETTLAHELAHALADQHFNLSKFVDDDAEDDDENLAHTAVVEGQASWLMLAYQQHSGEHGEVPTAQQLQALTSAADSSAGDYPVLDSSPLYIQQSLMFPYTEGIMFFDAVYRKQGKAAFRNVFTDAPIDTAQIYHPELYFQRVKPATPDIPEPKFTGGATELINGSLGEFDQRMLIWQFVGKPAAEKLSPHVRGGQYRIVEVGKKHKHPVLEYASEWDSDAAASEYFHAYATALRKKWQHCDATLDSATVFSGTGDNGYFVERIQGRRVTSVEGIPQQQDWKRILGEKNAGQLSTSAKDATESAPAPAFQ